jgi:import inner membrane translocase subunit TIM44
MNPAQSLRALRAPMRRAVVSGQPRAVAYTGFRGLASSAPRLNEAKEGEQSSSSKAEDEKKKKEEERKKRASADDNAPPQSPFKVFLRVFREEIDKNQGWQSNVKQLQGDVDKLADSAAMKKARDAYERTRVSVL